MCSWSIKSTSLQASETGSQPSVPPTTPATQPSPEQYPPPEIAPPQSSTLTAPPPLPIGIPATPWPRPQGAPAGSFRNLWVSGSAILLLQAKQVSTSPTLMERAIPCGRTGPAAKKGNAEPLAHQEGAGTELGPGFRPCKLRQQKLGESTRGGASRRGACREPSLQPPGVQQSLRSWPVRSALSPWRSAQSLTGLRTVGGWGSGNKGNPRTRVTSVGDVKTASGT